MKILPDAEIELTNASASLEGAWSGPSVQWNDNARRYFEMEFMQPSQMEAAKLVNSIQELSLVFEQARREIE